MNYHALILCFCGFFTSSYAGREANGYFNNTAHALRVYGHSYYNPMTLVPLQGVVDEGERLPFSSPKITFRGLPCACVGFSCGCCAGLNISAIKFDRRYCANFTVDPENFEIDMKVIMNDDEIYKTVVSARNPPPVCVPLPYVPILDFCLRLYDLSLETGNNLHTCIDFEARLTQSPLLVMHFNCVRVGASGVSWSKPGEDNAISYTSSSSTTATPLQEQASGVYDSINWETTDEPTNGYRLNGTTLSPEDEDKIGQHRISIPLL